MSSRMAFITGMLALSVAALPSVVIFAEEGGQEHGGKEHGGSSAAPDTMTQAAPDQAAPAAPEAPAAPAAPAASAPAVATPPTLKPIVITFSGDLAAVDAKASPGSITVQDRYGVRKEIAVPAEAKVAQGTATRALTDLKVGDKLTVEYTYDVASGKRTAQSINVGEGAPSAAGQ